ncbi:efflux RND transporter periplasmic adaptor subunit [Halioxenophilus aromaticivorans]|uniref:Multidrug efflux RND transporter periplasmic adaptor subunit MuxA n=1 Tax=Halioxenophilus aromaticivorans TaxID=1306992 RepID=A0AAV3U758_9ALTE
MDNSTPPNTPKRGRLLTGILGGGLVAVVAGAIVYSFLPSSDSQSMPPQRRGWDSPAIVQAQPAVIGDLHVLVKSIGTVTPLNTVNVSSRVGGILDSILFKEGATVEKGTVLAAIDPLPYEAQLEQVEGQLQQNQAKLANEKSNLALYETLWEQDSIARQTLSDQKALVNELLGTVKANEAAVKDARLQLSWTQIEAPISGMLGLRKVDQGNVVSTGDAEGLVTITQMQPITVNFTVPEVQVGPLRKSYLGNQKMVVDVLDREESKIIATGELTTLDNQIDLTTGTLKVRAQFANDDLALFPNQFVNVRLRLSTLNAALLIPGDAIQYGTNRSYVYVITEGKAYARDIVLGEASGDQVQVIEGLKEGELVVLEGLDRLRDGKQVILADAETGLGVSQPPSNEPAEAPPGRRPEGAPPPNGERPKFRRPENKPS